MFRDLFRQTNQSQAKEKAAPPDIFRLSAEDVNFWEDNGYLVIKGGISLEEVDRVLDVVNHEWNQRENNLHHIDILSGDEAGTWKTMSEITPQHRKEVYKLNNLFANSQKIRQVALSYKIKAALEQLLEGEPAICNSLNFERGSQQPFHLDTFYMPPPNNGRMIAANIALEAMHPDNGPFVYYPGSHKIEPYRFSNGLLNIIDAEAATCFAYINAEIERRNLKAEAFSCDPGDVFLWHENLFHGGLPINDMSKTRNSLVVHYWRTDDMPEDFYLRDENGAYIRRTLRGEISI